MANHPTPLLHCFLYSFSFRIHSAVCSDVSQFLRFFSQDYSKSDRMSEESCQTKTSEKSGDGIMNKASDTEDEDLETLSKDLHKNEDLPEEAKSMLGELQLDTSGNFDVRVMTNLNC